VLRRSLILALTAVASLGIAACGDDDEGASAPPAATTPAATTEAAPATESGQGASLQLVADPGGELAYDKESLEASAGQVSIALTNEAQVPHNVVIERGGRDVGATETITGSRTEKTFDLQAGEYTFYCSVGNHRDAGMEGKLTVR
jgi:plastocyanin